MRKAVFLDRDGVLNQAIIRQGKPYAPLDISELIINGKANDALKMLKLHGYLLIGATNQPDVARGLTSKDVVEKINQQLLKALPLDEIRVCYHDDVDNCVCRKPKPGLLLQAAKDWAIDLSSSFMIGDLWKDTAAGKAAACKSIWLANHYAKQPNDMDYTAKNLLDAAEWICKHR